MFSSKLERKKLLFLWAAVFIFHLAVFLFFFLKQGEVGGLFVVDAGDYTNAARNLISGHGFSISSSLPYTPNATIGPLYPLWLGFWYSLTGHFWPAVLAQIVLNSFLPILTILIGSYFIHDKRILLAAGIFTAIEPNLLYYTSVVATEGVFIFLLGLGLLTLLYGVEKEKLWWLVVSSAIFSLAVLTRLALQFLPLGLALWILLYYMGVKKYPLKKVFLYIAPFLFIYGAFLSPWALRNWVTFHEVSLSTTAWIDMYTRTGSSIRAITENTDYNTAYRRQLEDLVREGYISEPKEQNLYGFQFQPLLRARSLALIRAHPKDVVKIYTVAFVNILTQDNTYVILHEAGFLPPVSGSVSPTLLLFQHGIGTAIGAMKLLLLNPSYAVLYAARFVWLILSLFFFIGVTALLQTDSKARPIALLLFGTVSYFWLISVPLTGSISGRYRAPTIFLASLFICWGAFVFFQYTVKIIRSHYV